MIKKLLPFISLVFLISLLFSFTPLCLSAQTMVTVKVITKQAQPVPFATVKIFEEKDSVHSLEKITDSSGNATFNLSRTNTSLQ
jgi:hypothetical protein